MIKFYNRNVFILLASFIFSILLGMSFDLTNIPFVKKLSLATAVDNYRSVYNHEALNPYDIFPSHEKIIFTGSCQIESLWCSKDFLDIKCSIPHLVQDYFRKNNTRSIKAVNFGIPNTATSHNLFVFLKFLDDPMAKTFIWQNEFDANKLVENTLLRGYTGKEEFDAEVPFVIETLKNKLNNRPSIKVITDLLKEYEKEIASNSTILKSSLLYPVELVDVSEYSIKTFFSDLAHLRLKSIYNFIKFQNRFPLLVTVFERLKLIKKNARTILSLYDNLYQIAALYTPESFYLPSISLLHSQRDIKKPHDNSYYRNEDEIISNSTKEIALHSQVLVLKVVSYLAELKNKQVYLYFGPEGRCQIDNVYDKYYKNPLIKIFKDHKNIHILDLTRIPIDPKLEALENCQNLNFLGNDKAAQIIYEELKKTTLPKVSK